MIIRPKGSSPSSETDDYDPYSDDRLRLYWDPPLYPQQWSYRFCWMPIGPADPPEGSCLDLEDDLWPRAALTRRFNLSPEVAALPSGKLYRISPSTLSGGAAPSQPNPV
ncbi:MAG: hypothetical protein K6T61_09190 [Bryobacteraceae bacterium]|nr:hypothetical protein [Bryobacteraceae bacterium]